MIEKKPKRVGVERCSRGSVSVLLIGVVTMLVAVAGLVAGLAQISTQKVRLQSVADIAAVEGAKILRDQRALGNSAAGQNHACTTAAEIALANKTALTDCRTNTSGDVWVKLSITAFGTKVDVTARAGTVSP